MTEWKCAHCFLGRGRTPACSGSPACSRGPRPRWAPSASPAGTGDLEETQHGEETRSTSRHEPHVHRQKQRVQNSTKVVELRQGWLTVVMSVDVGINPTNIFIILWIQKLLSSDCLTLKVFCWLVNVCSGLSLTLDGYTMVKQNFLPSFSLWNKATVFIITT